MDLPPVELQAAQRTAADNCFVRLPPNVARRLWGEKRRVTGLFRLDKEDTQWSIEHEAGTSDRSTSGIEFLPLVITFVFSGRTIYLSYNGGDSASESVIELPFGSGDDPSAISSPTTTVHVSVLSAVATLPTVTVRPVSQDDWVLLELDATWLEQGGFLKQVSLVGPDQQIALVLPHHAIAHVQVVDCSCGMVAPCGRLMERQTQVIVQPFPSPAQRQWRLVPSRSDLVASSVAMQKVAEAVGGLEQWPPTPPPKSVLVHPEVWKNGYISLARVRKLGGTSSALVRVIVSEDLPLDAIVMHPLLRQSLSLPLFAQASRVAIEPLNGAELEVARCKFADAAPSLKVFFRWACVNRKRVSKACRVPDILESELMRDPEFPSVVLPDMPPMTPIEIGDLFYPPDVEGYSEGAMLQLSSSDSAALQDSVVMARDLWRLMSTYRSNSGEDESTTPEHISSCEGDLSGALLPGRHLLFPNVLQIAQEAIRTRRFVLCGERGSGKTHAACTVAALARTQLGSGSVYVDCRKLRDSSRRIQTILQELCKLMDEAAQQSPSCCVILDDIDLIAPQAESGDSTSSIHQGSNPSQSAEMMQSNLIAQILVHKLKRLPESTLVIATCRSLDNVSAYLATAGELDRSVSVPSLDARQRKLLFGSFLSNNQTTRDDCYKLFEGKQTTMYRPRDIEKLAQRVRLRLCADSGDAEEADKLLRAEIEKGFVPLSQIGIVNSADQSQGDVDWGGLGGLFAAKAQLKSSVLRPSRYQKIYAKAKIRTPRGVFLYGFPGTGKTACVHALAREGGFSLVKCKGPEILDKYIGASEAKVRELFSRAAAATPSILFLDEIDALAPRRGSDHTGVTDRVVNQLLTFLDGVEDFASNGSVYIIAATSRPDKVDPALLRPGRLERHVFFGCDNTAEEVEDLLLKVATKFGLETDVGRWIASRYDNDSTILPKLERLSAADMLSMFRSARLLAVNSAIAADRVDKMTLKLEHVQKAAAVIKPSLNKADREFLSSTYIKFGGQVLPESKAESRDQLVAFR